MNRYGINYITYRGITGHAIIEQKTPLSKQEIVALVNNDIAQKNCHDWVKDIEIEQLSLGASLASKILIKAATFFLK